MRMLTNGSIWATGVITLLSLLLANEAQERNLLLAESRPEPPTPFAAHILNENTQLHAQFPLPSFKAAVELTVCVEGPPSCQFKRIQDAIDAAPDVPGVTSWETPPQLPLIRVSSGIYDERVEIIAKNIWLRGEGGVTVRPGIFIAGFGSTAIGIEGLTIQGGIGVIGTVSGVIAKNNIVGTIALTGALTNLMISKNVFEGKNATGGGTTGILLQGVSPSATLGRGLAADASVFIAENEISGYQALGDGEGIFMKDVKKVVIAVNRIFHNRSWGIFLQGGAEATIANNLFESNGGAVLAYDSYVSLINNRAESNRYHAVSVNGGEYLIQRNQMRDNQNAGINVELGAKAHIVENIITGNREGLRVTQISDIKSCKGNQISGNDVNYADIAQEPNDELRRLCEESR